MYYRRDAEAGQSTVELALCLPVLAIVLGFVVEVALIGGDQVRLWHAAREAARVAVVDSDRRASLDAAERSGLSGLEMSIDPAPAFRVQGRPLTVRIRYSPSGRLPLVGAIAGGLTLEARATMRIEEP
ncbi:MAG: pilus assembly protein [Actinomycetota bacterium]|nr:pilus assembly protein [Actinomycetota bacterium]